MCLHWTTQRTQTTQSSTRPLPCPFPATIAFTQQTARRPHRCSHLTHTVRATFHSLATAGTSTVFSLTTLTISCHDSLPLYKQQKEQQTLNASFFKLFNLIINIKKDLKTSSATRRSRAVCTGTMHVLNNIIISKELQQYCIRLSFSFTHLTHKKWIY